MAAKQKQEVHTSGYDIGHCPIAISQQLNKYVNHCAYNCVVLEPVSAEARQLKRQQARNTYNVSDHSLGNTLFYYLLKVMIWQNKKGLY